MLESFMDEDKKYVKIIALCHRHADSDISEVNISWLYAMASLARDLWNIAERIAPSLPDRAS